MPQHVRTGAHVTVLGVQRLMKCSMRTCRVGACHGCPGYERSRPRPRRGIVDDLIACLSPVLDAELDHQGLLRGQTPSLQGRKRPAGVSTG